MKIVSNLKLNKVLNVLAILRDEEIDADLVYERLGLNQ